MADNKKPEVQANPPLSRAVQDVLTERARQVNAEGRTLEHDDAYKRNELAHAAACYACPELTVLNGLNIWPWPPEWFKVRDHRRNYVRAAALLLAEIERLDRGELHASGIRSSDEGSLR